jgi:3-oxoacyl-[acyl-carrier-protein] synthase-3
MRASITGVGHFVPEQRLTNDDLEQMVETSDEWITTRTGIKERRILDKAKGTSYMAIKATEMILEQRKISAEELDLILFATVTPDRFVPPAAAVFQKELKATNAWGFDVNGACSGFACALATGAKFVEAGTYKKVLVIGADKMSAIIDYQDRNTCVLFGDGGGAVLLEPANDGFGIMDYILHMDGSGADDLCISAGGSLRPATHETVENRLHYLYQNGRAVFKYAVTGMANTTERLLKKNNLTGEDLKLFIPHQANYRIIDAVAQRVGLKPHQVFLNIQKYGNTTAATLPIAMSEAYRDKKLQKGDWVVLSAFGAGFIWGSLLLKWELD